MSTDPTNDALTQLVTAALEVARESDGGLTHYLRWNYVRLANKLWPDDYTDDQLMAMNAVMAQAWSSKLARSGTSDPALDALVGVINSQVRRRPSLHIIGAAN